MSSPVNIKAEKMYISDDDDQPLLEFIKEETEEEENGPSTSHATAAKRKRTLPEDYDEQDATVSCPSTCADEDDEEDMDQYIVLHIKCDNQIKLIEIEKDQLNRKSIVTKISQAFQCSINYGTVKTNLGAPLSARIFLTVIKQYMNSASFYLEVEKDECVQNQTVWLQKRVPRAHLERSNEMSQPPNKTTEIAQNHSDASIMPTTAHYDKMANLTSETRAATKRAANVPIADCSTPEKRFKEPDQQQIKYTDDELEGRIPLSTIPEALKHIVRGATVGRKMRFLKNIDGITYQFNIRANEQDLKEKRLQHRRAMEFTKIAPKKKRIEHPATVAESAEEPQTNNDAIDRIASKNCQNFIEQRAAMPQDLPNADMLKTIPDMKKIIRNYDNGKPLGNKERVAISKAVIDKCLENQPNKVLSREDFEALVGAIISIFKLELESVYYIPSVKGMPARGKLYNAYSNKRAYLAEQGVIVRRPLKRRVIDADLPSFEDVEFLRSNSTDWPTITSKWSSTFEYRSKELSSKLSKREYFEKYPALQGKRGIELVSLDVKRKHPTIRDIHNWEKYYHRVVSRCHGLKDAEVCRLLQQILNSTDNHFKSQLALNLIPFILPHCGKKKEGSSQRATKMEIKERFIKEYKSLDELRASKLQELQIRFIQSADTVNYCDFNIAGYIFKFDDLLEALNFAFYYITATGIAYPKLCVHVWQFVQLYIFNVKLGYDKVAIIEQITKDLEK